MNDAAVQHTEADELALLRRYEPVVRMTEGELFLPADAGEYVARCELYERGPDRRLVRMAGKGELDLDRLAEFGRSHARPGQFLRLVDEPLSRVEVAMWRHRSDRPRFHDASRLARVGVLSRVIDAANRASLLVRGRVVSGTQAAAETEYRTHMTTTRHPYYGRVVRSAGYVVLQYWMFYAFNDWRSRVYGVNDHEADWEQVTIYLAEQPDGELTPSWVVFSAHDEVGDDLRRRWDDPDLTLVGDHPVVHPGLGSHSGAYLAGEYLTTFDGQAFHRVIAMFRAVTRLLLPWTRDRVHAGIGIPYIDYSRGDGISIGPGQQREWSPVLIDDHTKWVLDYRGLWGNDTQDPLGGERGPAGPRYERSTAVRDSWGDPVGWSGLRKVASNEAVAHAAFDAHVQRLADEIERLEGEIERRQDALRTRTGNGVVLEPTSEAELLEVVTTTVRLRNERSTLESSRGKEEAPGPHDHLRHRRMPMPPEPKVRRRVLAIWSAVSTPLVLVALIMLLVPFRTSLVGVSLISMLVICALEAAARRQFARFLMVTLLVAVVVTIAVAVVAGLIADWRRATGVLLAVAAIALLTINLVELSRD